MDLCLVEGFSQLTLDEIAARLGCSKRTLYALADSKEQLATLGGPAASSGGPPTRWRRRSAATRTPARRVTRYLEAVAEALRPACRAFRHDVATFPPAREVYEQNTVAAARRVRQLIDEGIAGALPPGPGGVRRRGRDGDHAAHHHRRDRRRRPDWTMRRPTRAARLVPRGVRR